ncbi:hypothetical protein C8Q70DRAFT_424053 [Cubamyces menziesii]|uniref:Uncharacterized protein n=1 Tax=Trametes cubensis TaxID=1111947 RepID=A0AAD7XGG2_9APHY|nr:hypothetical protein C8Q70DRAFT_424053 [Cubamyces menziesii]KAJ8496960.1 hypothetical protein ONZ51_g798 [Trametes cubensis]
MLARYAALVVLPFLSLVHLSWAGNTTCASGQLDWYTSVVGETPCMTYQRLRQICDSDYQVPNFKPQTPGDICDSQVSACCCNTVAFQLSMLCMNCQEDHLDGDQVGFDAPAGTYTQYRATCGAGTNNALPSDIQSAVCNEGIRLDDYLYGGWSDGSWFYVWTRENAERDHAANNDNTFTHCPNQISPSPTSTIKSTNTQQSTANGASTSPAGTTPAGSTPNQASDGQTNTSSSQHTTTTTTSGNPLDATPNGATRTPTGTPQPSNNPVNGTSSMQPTDANTPNNAAPTGNATSTNETVTSDGHGSHATSNTPAIVGGAVGASALVLLIVGGLLFWQCQARKTRSPTDGIRDPYLDHGHSPGRNPFDDSMTMATHGTYAAVGRGGLQQNFAPLRQGSADGPGVTPSSSAYSAATPVSGSASNENSMRHTDAGVTIPLFRSPSGRLPPAYHSWAHESNAARSQYQASPPESQYQASAPESMSVPSTAYGGAVEARQPLVPVRRDEKEEMLAVVS